MRERIICLLLCSVVITLPLASIPQVNSITIILLLSYTVYICSKTKTVPNFSSKKINLSIVYFILLCFSAFYSDNLYLSVKNTEKLLTFLFLPLAFVESSKYLSAKSIKYIYICFITSNIIALLICYTYALIIYDEYSIPLTKGYNYFTEILGLHSTYFSIYLIFSFSLIIDIFSCKKDSGNISFPLFFIKLSLLTFTSLSILFIKSRAGILSLFVVLLLYLAFYIHEKTNFFNKKGILLGISLGSLFIIPLFNNRTHMVEYFDKYLDRSTFSAINERLQIWNGALAAIADSPFWGYGIGDRQEALHKYYYITGFDRGIDIGYDAHNQFIQTLLTAGLLPFSVLFSMLIIIFVFFLKLKSKYILGFLIPVFVAMLSESILERQQGIVFFTFFYATFYITYNKKINA